MRVLYVSSVHAENGPSPMEELALLEPALEVHVVCGAAAALAEVRTGWEYRAVFLSPQLPHNEALALIATLRRDRAPLAVVAIVAEGQRDFQAAALAAGADDVLVALETGLVTPCETLRRLRDSHHDERAFTEPPMSLVAPAAETSIRDLTAEVRTLYVSLEAERRVKTELQEAEAFERVLRDRDREELTRLQHALNEERERRIVIEGTLRQTENRAAAKIEALEAQHAAARRRLEEQLATAADRLHQVAAETQVLQTRLQAELTAQAADRDRFIRHQLLGYALVTHAGELVRCNETFAEMFGFESADEAVAASAGAPVAALADHLHVIAELEAGRSIDRIESMVRRANGQPFRVLTSAGFRPNDVDPGGPALVERLFIDQDDRTRLEERLRLARRLEAAGRLTAEIANEIEPLLSSITNPAASADDRARVATLVAQLLAFGRRQARPAGLLLLHEAIRRTEPRLRQVAGDDVTFDMRVDDVGAVAAGEDDIDALLQALVFAAQNSLPYGGTILLQTRTARTGFTEQTELAASAAGYGVQPASISSSLERLVSRCGGTVHLRDEPARTTTLLVLLPR